MSVGDRVVYAGGLYTVAAVNGDLLTLDGLAVLMDGRYGRCRARVTVLAGDVARVGEQ